MDNTPIEQVLDNIRERLKEERPDQDHAMVNYIKVDGQKIVWDTIAIDTSDREEALRKMREVTEEDNFHCFANTTEGEEFFQRNRKAFVNGILTATGNGDLAD